MCEDDILKMEEKLENAGKMVIDLKDPNRPRFTLHELRDVLQERNELKTKLIELEDDLQHFKKEYVIVYQSCIACRKE